MTEFRHQIEAAIRPFRDVLLGLFFVGIGMLFDLSALPDAWHLALSGALALLALKALVVGPIVRLSGADALMSWRVALLLTVGGEFGFALLAIAFESGAIAGQADTAWRTVSFLRAHYPSLPIIARARDLEQSARLIAAGATRAYPEAIEASLRLGATALSLVGAAPDNVDLLIQDVRDSDYRLVSEDDRARKLDEQGRAESV